MEDVMQPQELANVYQSSSHQLLRLAGYSAHSLHKTANAATNTAEALEPDGIPEPGKIGGETEKALACAAILADRYRYSGIVLAARKARWHDPQQESGSPFWLRRLSSAIGNDHADDDDSTQHDLPFHAKACHEENAA